MRTARWSEGRENLAERRQSLFKAKAYALGIAVSESAGVINSCENCRPNVSLFLFLPILSGLRAERLPPLLSLPIINFRRSPLPLPSTSVKKYFSLFSVFGMVPGREHWRWHLTGGQTAVWPRDTHGVGDTAGGGGRKKVSRWKFVGVFDL